MTDFTISTKLAREFAFECFDVLSRESENAQRTQKVETKEVKNTSSRENTSKN